MLNTPQERRGSALVLCLILVTLIAGLGAGLVQVSAALQRKQNQSINNMRALYIAEAGLAEAFLGLSQGRSGRVGTEIDLATFAGGYFWVTAEEQEGGLVQLESTGLYRSGRFCLGAVVSSSFNPVGANGISSLGDLRIGPGSSLGVLDPNGTGTMAKLRAGGDVIFEGLAGESRTGGTSTMVAGNVSPGPEGIVEGQAYAEISGSLASSLTEMELPPVRFPDLGESEGDRTVENGSENNWSGDHRNGAVTVAPGGILTLTGPAVIYLDGLAVEPGGTLVFDTSNGPIELYLDDSINLAEGSSLSELGGDPSQAAIIVGSPGPAEDGESTLSVQNLSASGTFSGLIYTPYSELNISGSLEIVGSVSAGKLTLGSGSSVTYDPGLATGGVGVDLEVKMISWTVLGLPDAAIVQSQLDPKVTIALLGLSEKPSSEGSEDMLVKLEYFGTDNHFHIYSGKLADVDWSQVVRTWGIRWWDEESGNYSTVMRARLITDPDGAVDLQVKTGDGAVSLSL